MTDQTDSQAADSTAHDDTPNYELQFESRNERLREVIDTLAQYEQAELAKYGKKKEIADEHDLERGRITYVLDRWDALVEHRRRANTDPLDPDAVRAAYDDDTLREMSGKTPMTDGAGDITVDIELGLDQVFRSIKLLPGDLGLTFYAQTLTYDLPREEVRRLLDAQNSEQ